MSHPKATELALYAGGDLPIWRRWLLGLHLRECDACRAEIEAFRAESEWLDDAGGELPARIGWGRLAAEMRANIQVGLAAGEAVGPAEPHRTPLGWRAAAALASIALVLVSGWWLHLPRPRVGPSFEARDVLLEATPGGIELIEEKDRALTLLHSASEPVLVSVSVEGSMTARFVDDETGMVTINHVYVQ